MRASGKLTISHASANATGVFARPAESLLGVELGEVFSRQVMHEISNAGSLSPEPGQPGYCFRLIPTVEGLFDVAVHRYDDRRIFELQPSDSKSTALDRADVVGESFAARLSESRSALEQLRCGGGFGSPSAGLRPCDGLPLPRRQLWPGARGIQALGLESFLGLR
ncbi:MAG: hypothetical protein H6509_16270 [Bryobacterales bacterium]|nr:hypothetical protein [Bryobacterales bacterium]